MSLTINTHPTKSVVNAPEFNITTSLTESATYNNLRIRATVYVGGKDSPVAVLEQPKGLSDWNFSDLLKTFVGRMDKAVGGSDFHVQPSLSSELLTSWTSLNLSTFTTSGRSIISAINPLLTGDSYAISNDLGSVSVGDVVIIGIEYDWTDTGTNNVLLSFGTSAVILEELSYIIVGANKVYFHVVSVDNTTPTVRIGNTIGAVNFTATASIKTISDFIGNPAVYFKVKYEEVYENSSGVTTIGADETTTSLLYVPVSIPIGETFNANYLLAATNDKLLNESIRSGAKQLVGADMEHRVMYATDECYVRPYRNAGAGTAVLNCGYGFLIVNDTTITANDAIKMAALRDTTTYIISETLTITLDTKCQKSKVLSFKGDLGDEVFIFTGDDNKSYMTEKEFYKTNTGRRKPLSSKRQTQKILTTGYLQEDLRELLLQLIDTILPVWLFDGNAENDYRDVTVLTEDVNIINGEDLIENQILIEYHE